MGGKTTTSTSSVQIPPEIRERYNAVNTRAEGVAATPFQIYGTDPSKFVAQINPQQQQGIANVNAAAGAAQPYIQAGMGATAAGMGPANLGDLNVGQYLSPYLSTVVGSTADILNQQNEQAQQGALGTAIRSGAFGGDRAGIAAANLNQQQNLANANIISGLLNQGFTQAQGVAQQQQGAQLSAEQANLARLLAGGQQMAGLGAAAQQAGLQGAGAQIEAGTLGQQTEQAGLSALYNQFMQQQAYPFQVAQFLANIAMGTGALSGSTTQTTQPAPWWSDRRLKHDIRRIGKSDDGLPIYSFKYKGDDTNRTHVGFMADEVEKVKPEAVGLSGGYKTVDYDRATRASGGVVGPYSAGVGSNPGISSYVPDPYLPVSDLMVADPMMAEQASQSILDLMDRSARFGESLKTLNSFFGNEGRARGGMVGGARNPVPERTPMEGLLAAQMDRPRPELKRPDEPRQSSGRGPLGLLAGLIGLPFAEGGRVGANNEAEARAMFRDDPENRWQDLALATGNADRFPIGEFLPPEPRPVGVSSAAEARERFLGDPMSSVTDYMLATGPAGAIQTKDLLPPPVTPRAGLGVEPFQSGRMGSSVPPRVGLGAASAEPEPASNLVTTEAPGLRAAGTDVPEAEERRGLLRGLGDALSNRKPYEERNRLGQMMYDPETNKLTDNAILSILSGVAAMASSPSLYLGSSILQGVGGFANTLAGLREQEARIDQTRAGTEQTRIQTQVGRFFTVGPNGAPLVVTGEGPYGTATLGEYLQNPERYSTGDPEVDRAILAEARRRQAMEQDNIAPVSGGFDVSSYIDNENASAQLNYAKTMERSAALESQILEAAAASMNAMPDLRKQVEAISAMSVPGADVPSGAFSQVQNTAVRYINGVLARAGYEPLSSAPSEAEIAEKMGVLRALGQTSGSGQMSFEALERALALQPGQRLEPATNASLVASIMMENQHNIDLQRFVREDFKPRTELGTITNAPAAYAEKMASTYAMERPILETIILNGGPDGMRFLNLPDNSEEARQLKMNVIERIVRDAGYSGQIPPDIIRYFGG